MLLLAPDIIEATLEGEGADDRVMLNEPLKNQRLPCASLAFELRRLYAVQL